MVHIRLLLKSRMLTAEPPKQLLSSQLIYQVRQLRFFRPLLVRNMSTVSRLSEVNSEVKLILSSPSPLTVKLSQQQ